jgi:hypothetical protein
MSPQGTPPPEPALAALVVSLEPELTALPPPEPDDVDVEPTTPLALASAVPLVLTALDAVEPPTPPLNSLSAWLPHPAKTASMTRVAASLRLVGLV